MIVKVTGTVAVVVFVSEPLMLPEPLEPIPKTEMLLFRVQSKTVPGTLLVFTIVVMAEPSHMVCEVGVATPTGVGLTNNVAGIVVPKGQPVALVGVMVKVTVIGAVIVLVNVPLIFPVPLAAMPVTAAVLFLVQVYPPAPPESTIVVMADPEQLV